MVNGPESFTPDNQYILGLLDELIYGYQYRYAIYLYTFDVYIMGTHTCVCVYNVMIAGEAPELNKFFVAAGFNSSGIASSGGANPVWFAENDDVDDKE